MLQLITQIIILATALVGLYKVARFSAKRSSNKEPAALSPTTSSGSLKRFFSHFEDFFELLGMFAFMLAFPLFVWAFMWVMNNMIEVFDEKQTPKASLGPEYIETLKEMSHMPEKGSRSYIILKASEYLSSSSKRNELLKKAAEIAIQEKAFEIAILSVSGISSSREHDSMLAKIIEAAVMEGNFVVGLKALPLFRSTSSKSLAASLLAAKAAQSQNQSIGKNSLQKRASENAQQIPEPAK